MRWRGILCALAALCMLVVAPIATGEDTTCTTGYVESGSTEQDTDQDDLLCVNPSDGTLAEDQDALRQTIDKNGDQITCVRVTGNGSIVRTDNSSAHEENEGCPPAFSPTPIS